METAETLHEKIVEFTRELINIPTTSGDPGQLDGYRRISALISSEMKRIGLSIELCESEPGFINVVGRKGGKSSKRSKRRLLLNGHVDVAPTRIEDWITDPFHATVKDGQIWGRGASDMKGGIAAMVFAAEKAIAATEYFNGELILAATVDEEMGGFRGLKYLIDQGLTADMAVVCEPTNLEIGRFYKGLFWVKVTTKGKESHGSMPENGVNAIAKMGKIITEGLSGFSSSFPSHDVLGRPTLNIGTISGGQKPNVVPPFCEMELDIRFLPGQTIEMMLNRITELIEKVKQTDPDLEYQVSSVIRSRMPLEIEESQSIIQLIREATKKVIGKYPKFRGMTSPGDGDHLIKAGIPSVMFGPGNDRNTHVANEFIEIDQITKAAEIYTRVILDLLS